MGSVSQFKSSPIKSNQAMYFLRPIKWRIYGFFLWFYHENRLVGNFHYYIRYQCVKIRKYGEFYSNLNVYLFGTSPLMGFGSFCLENLIFLEK